MTPPRRRWRIKVCAVCGRDDRYRPFTGKFHWDAGRKCSNENLKDIEVAPVGKGREDAA